MLSLAKALLLIARYFRRITLSLESIERLYRLELQSQGIIETDPDLSDEVEITYGPREAIDRNALDGLPADLT
jgi:hypothetical protein